MLASALLFSITGTSCSSDDAPVPEQKKEYDMSGFAKGADVSWITEMEQNGKKFYNANGKATECMALLRDLGMNSIRLRVWVNPEDGWNGKNDVVAKAWRAQQLPPGAAVPRGASPRPAPSSRLRTGADQGNPTV